VEICYVKEITTAPTAILDQLGQTIGTPETNTYYEIQPFTNGQFNFGGLTAFEDMVNINLGE
jgi:hypothetical protein